MAGIEDTAGDDGQVQALFLGSSGDGMPATGNRDGVVLIDGGDGTDELLEAGAYDCIVVDGETDLQWDRLDTVDLPIVLYAADAAAVGNAAVAVADAFVERGDDTGQSLAETLRTIATDRSRGTGDLGRAPDSSLYRQAVEGTAVPTAVVDSAGRVRLGNGAMAALFDESRSALHGSDLSARLAPPTDADLRQSVRRALDDDTPVTVDICVDEGGRERRFATTVSPLADGTGAVVTCHEVTERAHRRDELDLLKQVLTRVFRHDIRSGLTVIRGQAEVLSEQTEGSEREMAQTIIDHSESLVETTEKARAIRNVLDSDDGRVAFDLRTTVDRAVATVATAHPDVEYETRVPENCRVFAHRALPHAVENLVENAAEHGTASVDEPEDGSPDESADGTVAREGKRVSVTAEQEGETVVLRVSDDGPGIDESQLEVLDRREETPLKHGTGVGLWLVDRVVERSGGDLSFDADGGTTVTIRLERASEETDE